MYLTAKRYLWSFPEDGPDATLAKQAAQLIGVSKHRVKQIEVEAIYWRKSNAVHQWFVDNVQDGKDDCGEYEVSREQLQALLDLIIKVIDSKDATNLPPTSGFFFGSTAVDEWYWDDLKTTKGQLTELLADPIFKQFDFYYHSSW